jgi:hypothetical protein
VKKNFPSLTCERGTTGARMPRAPTRLDMNAPVFDTAEEMIAEAYDAPRGSRA